MNNTKESDRTEFKKLTSEKKTTKKYFVLALILVVILICLYPVIVLLFMLWFVRILFGIHINVPKDLPVK